jgi:hypothetical protein
MKTMRRLPKPTKASLHELLKLRRELDSWRKSQPGRASVPEEVWELAEALARTHGVSRVSRTLRLSFYKLRRRVQVQVPTLLPSGAPVPSGFIELAPMAGPGVSGGACVIELYDARQSRMTIRLSGEGSALLGLVEAFWRRGQ